MQTPVMNTGKAQIYAAMKQDLHHEVCLEKACKGLPASYEINIKKTNKKEKK